MNDLILIFCGLRDNLTQDREYLLLKFWGIYIYIYTYLRFLYIDKYRCRYSIDIYTSINLYSFIHAEMKYIHGCICIHTHTHICIYIP